MREPAYRLLLHPVHFLTLGFGSGLARWAPGTVGTLAGWFLWPLLRHQMGDLTLVAWLVAATLFGLWACGVTARALGDDDPGAVVWDEIVALWWVLLLLPERFDLQLVAVLLFRLFDIAKPWPIGAVERRFSGGVGIMIDDLVAAAMTLLVVATARHYALLP
ncbi:hypothetical protein JCM16106_18370 [Hydrogenophilus islandicus]